MVVVVVVDVVVVLELVVVVGAAVVVDDEVVVVEGGSVVVADVVTGGSVVTGAVVVVVVEGVLLPPHAVSSRIVASPRHSMRSCCRIVASGITMGILSGGRSPVWSRSGVDQRSAPMRDMLAWQPRDRRVMIPTTLLPSKRAAST